MKKTHFRKTYALKELRYRAIENSFVIYNKVKCVSENGVDKVAFRLIKCNKQGNGHHNIIN